MRAWFAFSGLELRVMTLPTKYQEFVRQQDKQLSSLDFDREEYCGITRMARARLGILETGTIFSTQVSCVNTSAECRLWATSALAIPMTTLQLPR
jgi:hypothetical protein